MTVKNFLDYLKGITDRNYRFGQCYGLDGSSISAVEHPESNKFTAFALTQTYVDIESEEGERPSAEMLWGKLLEGAIP